MLLKPKKCKGTGKALGSGCGKLKFLHKYGLCTECFGVWLYNTPEGKEMLSNALKRGKEKAPKIIKQIHNQEKRELTDPKPILQKKINEIVRLIDHGMPCLATGSIDCQINAGHIHSVGSNDTLRFNLHNIHRQSANSNGSQKDDGKMMLRASLEYGKEYGEFIERLTQIKPIKLSRVEMKEKIKVCNSIIRDLRIDLVMYPKQKRIELRNQFNQQLGIYPEEYSVFKIKNHEQIEN